MNNKVVISEQVCTVIVFHNASFAHNSMVNVCFVTAMSNADGSTGSITHDSTGSFKSRSAYLGVGSFEQSRQPSYLAAVTGSSSVSQVRDSSCISALGKCTSQDASQELLPSMSHNGLVVDKNNYKWNKHCGLSKSRTPMTGSKCEMSAKDAATKLHTRSFSDLEQWLQNGEDDTVRNYIDRRVVESVLKCRQFHKQFPEKKRSALPTSHRLNYVTNIGGVGGGVNNGSHEAQQHGQCRPNVTEDLYQEFSGKMETEVDDDSGFSGDRNSASSTSSGLSVESSLTSLGSVTDFWSGERSSSGSATSVLSVDQSTIEPAPPVKHIPGPVPPRTSSLSNNSSSSALQVAPDVVQSNRLVSEQLYGTLTRRKTAEPSSRSSPYQPEISSCHNQERLPLAANSGWCSSDVFFAFL